MAHEPYLDFDRISEEQAEKLQLALHTQELARTGLLFCEPEDRREAAANYLKGYHAVQDYWSPLIHELYTVPVFVHTASERMLAEDHEVLKDDAPDDALVQVCTNCGTLLRSWMPGLMEIDAEGGVKPIEAEDADWFEAGVKVTKEAHPEAPPVGYAIDPPDRDLEDYETPCVGSDALEGEPDE